MVRRRGVVRRVAEETAAARGDAGEDAAAETAGRRRRDAEGRERRLARRRGVHGTTESGRWRASLLRRLHLRQLLTEERRDGNVLPLLLLLLLLLLRGVSPFRLLHSKHLLLALKHQQLLLRWLLLPLLLLLLLLRALKLHLRLSLSRQHGEEFLGRRVSRRHALRQDFHHATAVIGRLSRRVRPGNLRRFHLRRLRRRTHG